MLSNANAEQILVIRSQRLRRHQCSLKSFKNIRNPSDCVKNRKCRFSETFFKYNHKTSHLIYLQSCMPCFEVLPDIRVSTVVVPSSAQFKIRRHSPIDNLYSNNFLIKTSSNSFCSFKDCKYPIFRVKFLNEKSAESF